MSRQDRDNRARYLVLNSEDVDEFAVVSLGPTVRAGRGIDELRRDADAVAAAPNAALQYISCAQLPPDLPDIDRLALVLEGRIARDNHELRKPRQLGRNVLGNTVAEIVLLRIAAEVSE